MTVVMGRTLRYPPHFSLTETTSYRSRHSTQREESLNSPSLVGNYYFFYNLLNITFYHSIMAMARVSKKNFLLLNEIINLVTSQYLWKFHSLLFSY